MVLKPVKFCKNRLSPLDCVLGDFIPNESLSTTAGCIWIHLQLFLKTRCSYSTRVTEKSKNLLPFVKRTQPPHAIFFNNVSVRQNPNCNVWKGSVVSVATETWVSRSALSRQCRHRSALLQHCRQGLTTEM